MTCIQMPAVQEVTSMSQSSQVILPRSMPILITSMKHINMMLYACRNIPLRSSIELLQISTYIARDWQAKFSKPDPEMQHSDGGVATMMQNAAKYHPAKAKTTFMQKALESGRLQMTMAILPNKGYVLIFNRYGWVNAHYDSHAACRTQHIISTIRQ